jgi:hypothetical protein
MRRRAGVARALEKDAAEGVGDGGAQGGTSRVGPKRSAGHGQARQVGGAPPIIGDEQPTIRG